jgi:hypothetical protein
MAELIEGTKNDQGKPRTDLLDPAFLTGVASVLSFGAEKYAANNWRQGISYSRILGGILRHVFEVLRGEDYDPESGLKHTYHAACGLMFLSWYLDNRKEFDDRYKY